MNSTRQFLYKERSYVSKLFENISKNDETVLQFLTSCECCLFNLAQKAQKPDIYRAGIQDLVAKSDYFHLDKVASTCTSEFFLAGDAREIETKLIDCIRNPKDRKFTESLYPQTKKLDSSETMINLISTETLLTDQMGKILLSISDGDTFQCSKCHQWTLSYTAKQTRSGDEMATEQRYCSTCKK